jgi:protein-S-isoprenylcysteine O-methyltransferase Ste14
MSDKSNRRGLGVIIQVVFFVFVIPLLPLLISWRWNWWEAWVYAVLYSLSFAISRLLAARKHPDLIAERARLMRHADIKPWDKTLAPLVALGAGLILVVAGLDARFGWTAPLSLAIKLVALVVILAGYALGSYAIIVNRFFSGVVRIQKERGHQVVSSGPYAWVRHPGYAGGLLTYLATPLFLNSSWAFLPAALVTLVLALRTSLEDRTLQAELPGYKEYASRVRYRLLPGVW